MYERTASSSQYTSNGAQFYLFSSKVVINNDPINKISKFLKYGKYHDDLMENN